MPVASKNTNRAAKMGAATQSLLCGFELSKSGIQKLATSKQREFTER